MKKLFYVVMLLGSLSLFACNDNSEEVYEELEPVKIEAQNGNIKFNHDFDDRGK